MRFNLFLLLGLLIMAPNNSDARSGRLEPIMYTVVSDEKDKTIEAEHYVIQGSVKMFSSLNPLDNVLIGCTSSGTWVRSNAEGLFEVTLKSTDSLIYFYKEGWSELVIEDYTFKEKHRVTLDVTLYQAATDVKRKPVIYLYSEEPVKASIQLDPKGEFTFTYPVYSDSWEVEVNPEKPLKVKNKEYPYLFWEAKSKGMHYILKDEKLPGFLIESKNVTAFFEEKLSLLGLNQTEKTDFITYWGPVLSHKKFAFIQFVIDEDYDSSICGLEMNPQPDNSRRIFIQCCGLDDQNIGIEITEQSFTPFTRSGFTLVEWGGAVLDLNQLTP